MIYKNKVWVVTFKDMKYNKYCQLLITAVDKETAFNIGNQQKTDTQQIVDIKERRY